MNTTIHQGRNIKRFREMLGIKQEAFAVELGEDWNQQKISLLEQKEMIDESLLQQIAAFLKVPADAIKNFDEEAAINIISTTFNSHDNSTSVAYRPTFNFNPVDKIIELYEALVKSEKEKTDILQKLMENKK